MQALEATKTYSAACARQSGSIQFAEAISLPGFVKSFARNDEIFAEEAPADFVYKVISGAVRTVRILSDGRRHVGAFHLPGEVFGLEIGAVHRFTAEAVSDCQIALIRRSHIEKAAGQEADTACGLWTLVSQELNRLQDHMLQIGRKSAAERVGSFLVEMADRTGRDRALDLPMSRLDIADYLGLTIETVSRTMTQFERDRAIALPSCRRVVLLDPERLCAA